MFKAPKSVILSGKEVLPIIEGGKGIAVSNGRSAGAFAAAGAVGTFSGVNGDSYDENGEVIPQIYKKGSSRKERFAQLIQYGIAGGIAQAKIAHEHSKGNGRIFMNTLWEAGGAQDIIKGVLEGAKGLIHGVVCGAGMPYKLAEIASQHKVWYYPIVSSSRAFRILWLRAYSKASDFLGGVVYEDPWRAGGHNGLSNAENPLEPQDPYERLKELRAFMNKVGLNETPIIIAGGVWSLSDWQDYIDNPEIGPVAFQMGTRPMLTKESPVSQSWRNILRNLKEGDVGLNRFSPTGFWSSAIKNSFLKELIERSKHQIFFKEQSQEEYNTELKVGGAKSEPVFVKPEDYAKAEQWQKDGLNKIVRTPDDSILFLTKEKAKEIRIDQAECMGCLSHCMFSSWATNEENSTGKIPDPRSYCIQKTLQNIAHGGEADKNLAFAGHAAYRFKDDPLYKDGKESSVAEFIKGIMQGL
ncbi:MAG: NAD(P)H-dependent flavin oxidoreductase [Alphaproteobacteria bacterium]